jgi:hypothetical protein
MSLRSHHGCNQILWERLVIDLWQDHSVAQDSNWLSPSLPNWQGEERIVSSFHRNTHPPP